MTDLLMPNVRSIFIPDPGYELVEVDLKGADAQVVAWDAGDEDLKMAFKRGLDVHDKNATDLLGAEYSDLAWDAKGTSPPSLAHIKKYAHRQRMKKAVHATNYGTTYRTLAQALKWSEDRARRFIRQWFDLHPAIEGWHRRIERDLAETRTIRNAFGYWRIFYDRLDDCFTEALAWTPQSTVALASFKGGLQVRRHLAAEFDAVPMKDRWLRWKMQVHDSLLFQVKIAEEYRLGELRDKFHVVVPYADPLIIPVELKVSKRNWGSMEGRSWEQYSKAA